MYLTHFGFDEAPFRITPHTDFFYGGANRGATLEALLYAVQYDEGIVKVSGEVGSGKTMLCRVLMERLPQSVETIYLANPSLGRDEILIAIADELNLDLGTERSTRLVRALQDELIRLYSSGRRVVVLIDEAHAMPRETLEEIRLLSNLEANRHKLLQIVLFGQPELDQHLDGADMRQLKERITHSFRLAPMAHDEIESYIEFRLRAAGYRGPNPFSAAAVRHIINASQGLTRRINILADKALLAAFASNSHSVTEREVKRAVDDSEFYRPGRTPKRATLVALSAAGGVLAGFIAGWLIMRGDGPAPAASSAKQPMGIAATAPGEQEQHTRTKAITPESRAADLPAVSSTGAGTVPVARPELSDAEDKPRTAEVRAIPGNGKRFQARFEATQDWLEAAPGKNYAIQLIAVKESDLWRMEDFLAKASRLVPEEDLHVYRVKIDGIQHYRAAYGNFSGSSQAIDAIKELPPLLKGMNPFHRSVERMKSQNRQ